MSNHELKREYAKVAGDFKRVTGRSAEYVIGNYNSLTEKERIEAVSWMRMMIAMEEE